MNANVTPHLTGASSIIESGIRQARSTLDVLKVAVLMDKLEEFRVFSFYSDKPVHYSESGVVRNMRYVIPPHCCIMISHTSFFNIEFSRAFQIFE